MARKRTFLNQPGTTDHLDRLWAALARVYSLLLSEQTDLDPETKRVLSKRRWDLYE